MTTPITINNSPARPAPSEPSRRLTESGSLGQIRRWNQAGLTVDVTFGPCDSNADAEVRVDIWDHDETLCFVATTTGPNFPELLEQLTPKVISHLSRNHAKDQY